LEQGESKFLFPVIGELKPMPFQIVPTTDDQPFLVAECGHKVWRRQRLEFPGEGTLESKENKAIPSAEKPWWMSQILWNRRYPIPNECDACRFEKLFVSTILCVRCRCPIMYGDPVSVYMPSILPEDFDDSYTAHVKGGFIGCMGGYCCPTGGFYAGHWNGDGVLSPYGAGSAAAECFAGEELIAVSNIGPLC